VGDFMIFLNKNKILFILSCIIFSILFFNFTNNSETIETSSTPVSNHTIILDAGHGLPDRTEQKLLMELSNLILIYQ